MKRKLEGANLLYPTPTVLVGSVVNGKSNFITVAHVGILNAAPPHLISIGLGRAHHSNVGIRANEQFSLNIPSRDLVVETDYCGIVTGRKVDEAALFEIFFGKLGQAPMIAGCPVNMACRLDRIVDTPSHDVFIGEIVETFADEHVMTSGKIDYAKVQPLLFDMPTRRYWSIGEPIADCWSVGKALKKK